MPSEAPQWFIDHINKLGGAQSKGKGTGKGPRGKGKGKGVRIQFEGCWHCGKKDHSRSGCEVFQKLLAAANKGVSDRKAWKLPEGYCGKYEEAKKRAKADAAKGKSSKVNALSGDENTEDEWEGSDDEDIMGPAAPGQRMFALRVGTCSDLDLDNTEANDDVQPPPTPDASWTRPIRNATYDDYDGDRVKAAWVEAKEDLVNHLSGWAHKTVIKVQGHKGKTTSKFVVNSEPDLERMLKTKCKIANLAAAANSKRHDADTKLPDLPLEDDEIWALIDSGSTLNAAWIKKHFPEYIRFIIASKQQMRGDVATTAGGHELKHKGRCKVDTEVDGIDMPIAFSNIKVDVPILSVRRMVKLGNDVIFTESGGTITNRATGNVLHFIEAEGTYWIKLKIKKPDEDAEMPDASDLTRRGA